MEGSDIRYRALAIEDYAEVFTLWASSPGIGLGDSDTAPAIAMFLHRNPGLSLVAEDQGRIVGTVLCGHDGRRGFLHHLIVAPSHRRRGIARTLVERCRAQLVDLGLPRCSIHLFADNAGGRAFWEKLGWTARRDLLVVQMKTL